MLAARYRRLRRSMLLASALVALLLVLLALVAGWRDYVVVKRDAAVQQRNLLLVAAEHARWTFWAADTMLSQAELVVRTLGRAPTLDDAKQLHPQLNRMLAPPGESQRWFLVDRHGQLLTSALRVQAFGVDVSDRDYFQFHETRKSSQLHIGVPLQTRPSGIWSFTVTRGVYDADGQLVAIVGLAIGLPYFLDFYSRLDLGPEASAVLARADGQLLIRQPFDPAHFATPLRRLPELLREAGGRPLQDRATSPYDQRPRLISLLAVPGYPVAALITVAEDQITKAWRQRMAWLAGAVLLGLLCIGVFSWQMWRQVARLERSDVQALSDRLTGLPNRHAFDAALQRELGRARRERRPLLMAMVDVDHFKRYNDSLGHAAGDRALQAVAGALTQALRRPGDLVARWGGEEFVALLPGCNAEAALTLGESLRAAVAALALPHPGLGEGVQVSVSIGLALWQPGMALDADALLAAADAALYEAKRQGRDRVLLQTEAGD